MKKRFPSVAGMFYPKDKDTLLKDLAELKISKEQLKVTAIIVPHAGYIYSGKTAINAYKLVSKDYKKVIILGPNHTVYSKKAVLDVNDEWETPLGVVKTWKPSLGSNVFVEGEAVHRNEHGIETQLPFLQVRLQNFEVLPIIVGDINESDANAIAKALLKLLDDKTLLVISTDLSHFLTEKHALEVDNETIDSIINVRDVSSEYACGANPLRVANKIFRELRKKPEFLTYTTSAEISGDKNSVVGYASFIVR